MGRASHARHECDWEMWPECCRCAVPLTKKLIAKLEAAKLGPPFSNSQQRLKPAIVVSMTEASGFEFEERRLTQQLK